jgi:hypothetical protein
VVRSKADILFIDFPFYDAEPDEIDISLDWTAFAASP